jgi:predicted O-methyltransferase YrrM
MIRRRVARIRQGVANSLEAYGARRRLGAEAPATLPDAYDFIASFQYGQIRPAPFQVRSEMLALLMMIGSPSSIVELGTARGGTLFLFTRVAAPNATIVTVDVENGPFGGGYPRSHNPLLRSFARDQQTVRLIRGDSRAPNTLRRVRDVSASLVDLLFIDADHTYEGVRSDYEMYAPLVKSGGIVAFHDIVPGPPENVGGVPEFWAELTGDGANSEEIVEDWRQGGYGIGVVRVP